MMDIQIPEIYEPLFKPKRFKVLTGSRGSAKSETVARYALIKSASQFRRWLCTREFQTNIHESVHRTLEDVIIQYGMTDYQVLKYKIINKRTGSEFIFEGLQNMDGIKSIKGITDVWCEEAHRLSQESLDKLIPTIREPDSELVFTLNIETEDDPIVQTFLKNKRDDVLHIHSTYRDNPFFPDVLRTEMEYCKRTNYDKYMHIWEGNAKKQSDAQIFKGKWIVQDFELPFSLETGRMDIFNERLFYGADWGFANDPCFLTRSFIKDRKLFIEYEASGIGVELDEIPQLFDSVPDVRKWNIKADNSRPETISHVAQKGFNIEAAEKWPGSVEDGVEYLRSFEQIVIHPRCKRTIDEFKFYSYKVDKQTQEILPIIVDKHNHAIDSLRYSLESYIKKDVTDWNHLYNKTRAIF